MIFKHYTCSLVGLQDPTSPSLFILQAYLSYLMFVTYKMAHHQTLFACSHKMSSTSCSPPVKSSLSLPSYDWYYWSCSTNTKHMGVADCYNPMQYVVSTAQCNVLNRVLSLGKLSMDVYLALPHITDRLILCPKHLRIVKLMLYLTRHPGSFSGKGLKPVCWINKIRHDLLSF